MAKHELDQLWVYNPTDRPFSVKWGGVTYTLQPGEKKIWMRFLAEHFAKHLTNAILLGKEQEHKKAFLAAGGSEKEYMPKSYLNSRTLRPQVINTILLDVYQYHQGGAEDPNAMIQAQIDQLNPDTPKERELDLGEGPDPLYGVLKADKDETQAPPQMTQSAPMAGAPLPAAAAGASMVPSGDMTQPPAQSEAADESTETEASDTGRSMAELREEAKRLDITVPFGTSKAQLQDMIRKQYA